MTERGIKALEMSFERGFVEGQKKMFIRLMKILNEMQLPISQKTKIDNLIAEVESSLKLPEKK